MDLLAVGFAAAVAFHGYNQNKKTEEASELAKFCDMKTIFRSREGSGHHFV